MVLAQMSFCLCNYDFFFLMESSAVSLHRTQKTIFKKSIMLFSVCLAIYLNRSICIFKDTLEDTYLSEEDEEALTSCMKLAKPQEKKAWKDNVRRKEETETRAEFISASLGRSYTSKFSNLGMISIHSETEFHLWSDWKPFPDNQLCPCDFLISKIEEWEKCTCASHQPHLANSLTDMDLQYSWVSGSGSFCTEMGKK